MLTICAISNGEGYDSKYLGNSDYYSEGEKVAGHWQGNGAEKLGLSGEVTHEQFEALRQGLHPATGEFLRQRHSADRTAADGTDQSKARHLYDFTLSAPKGVSVLAAFADERLVESHRRAVDAAIQEAEVYAGARVRKNGANESRRTGNLAIAVYHHDTSRELDPQLHAHCVAANLTYDAAEQKWKALDSTAIYDRRSYISEVYRNMLASDLLQKGYTIHNHIDARGKDCGFEIDGIPAEVLKKFSQRSAQRDAAIAEFVQLKGRQPTDREVVALVVETRAEKLAELSTAEVKQFQQDRLTAGEREVLKGIRQKAQPVPAEAVRAGHSAEASLQHAQDHVFERISVARDHVVYTEALRHGRGRIELPELHQSLKAQEATRASFRHGDEIATRASLEREREMVATIDAGIGSYQKLAHMVPPATNLREEQQAAVRFVLASKDFAINLQGAAGTGKTMVLEEIRRGLDRSQQGSIALAPSVSAVAELQKVGFPQAITTQRFLGDAEAQAEARGKVIILDEAGMVSGQEMAHLLTVAKQQNMRIVFAGDTKQLRSVEAGDALRILERDSKLKSVTLTQVQRQTVAQYREAVQTLRINPLRGYDKLAEMGAVQEVHGKDRAAAVRAAYTEAATPGRKVLVVAATHDELGLVNAAIREDRKARGELAHSKTIERHVPLNFTAAQRRDASSFAAGQLLAFHRKSKWVAKHEVLEVVRLDGRNLVVRTDKGTERVVTPASQSGSFGVFERREFDLGPGDRVLLMENRSGKKLKARNGELATVAKISQQGHIHLDDGRVLPANYRQIDHGYAITTHRSQGKSVDAVIISADAMNKECFYVAATRARQSISVITSDPAQLRHSIMLSGDRESATDLHRASASHQHRNAQRAAQEQPPKIEIENTQSKGVGHAASI